MPDLSLAVTVSVNGHGIRLTERQWAHIVESHDYMAGNLEKVMETISDPEIVVEGDGGESLALRLYAETNITRKTVVAVFRDNPDGFVITAFMTSEPDRITRKRSILWKRK